MAGGDVELRAEKATTPPPAESAKRSKTAGEISPLNVSKTPAVEGAAGRRATTAAVAAVGGNAAASNDPVLSAGLHAASLLAQHGRQQKGVVDGANGAAVGEQRMKIASIGTQQQAGEEGQQAVAPPAADVAARQEAMAKRQAALKATAAVATPQALALAARQASASAAGRQNAAGGRHTQQPSPPPAQQHSPFRGTTPQRAPPMSTGASAGLPAASVAAVNAFAHAPAQPFSTMTPSHAVPPRSNVAVPMTRDTSRLGEQGRGVVHQPWARPSISNAVVTAAAAHANPHAHAGPMTYGHTQARAPVTGGLAFPPGSTGAVGSAGMVVGFQRVPQSVWTSSNVPGVNTAHFQALAPTPQQAVAAPGTPFVPVTDSYQAQMRATLGQSMWRGYGPNGVGSLSASQTAGRVDGGGGDAGRLGSMGAPSHRGVPSAGAVPAMVSPLAPAAALQHYSSSRNAGATHPGGVCRWPSPEQGDAAGASAPSAAVATTATGPSTQTATSPRPCLLGKRKTPSPDAAVLTRAQAPAAVSPWSDRPLPAADASAAQPEDGSGGPPLEGGPTPFGPTAPPPPPPSSQSGSVASAAAPAMQQNQPSNASPSQGAAAGGPARETEEKRREQDRAVATREDLRRAILSVEHLHIQFRSFEGPDAGSRGDDERSRLYLLGEWRHMFCFRVDNFFPALTHDLRHTFFNVSAV